MHSLECMYCTQPGVYVLYTVWSVCIVHSLECMYCTQPGVHIRYVPTQLQETYQFASSKGATILLSNCS